MVGYLEDDPRIQVVFTVAPDVFNGEVPAYLSGLGALTLPWDQAIRERFDLAIAASYGGLRELHAPLVVMAHGAGHGKRVCPGPQGGRVLADPPVYGLDAQRLVDGGRVLPAALVLSHDSELKVLRRQCPEALETAVVVGDPCFDRLAASLGWRDRYRQALGVDDGRELVVVSSTWGRNGLFGHAPDLLPTVMTQLPQDRFRVAALLHPAVWAAHGRRQVRAWLTDCLAAGLLLPDPTQDWRAVVVAADYVIGDHGSVTAYSAAIGRRVLLLPGLGVSVASGSPQHLVSVTAPKLDLEQPLTSQLEGAKAVNSDAVRWALTARPGNAAVLLRRTMYELLRLGEPGRHRQVDPVPVAHLLSGEPRDATR
ncbi:hypothetical protein ACI2K4_29225 [Micromonospora sp. NPDC050397]|uniref:hypothetical protein n=1 Tax=Micromonospora sp. NPDC050397 TaxID=3364279 RepID=UPI00384A9414